MNFVAFSGGKDSTALVLRLAELGEPFECIFTPTGNELTDLAEHMASVLALAGSPKLNLPPGPKLIPLIEEFGALPNWRQRWCTRLIKIEPCIAFLRRQATYDFRSREWSLPTLMVGLRADEGEREGLYGPYAHYRYPMREWGWDKARVLAYVVERGMVIPKRTDCAMCYGQRLGEWFVLWRDHPDEYARAEFYETKLGHTLRSPQRDTWPAALRELRQHFEAGRIPRGVDEDEGNACRVCSL